MIESVKDKTIVITGGAGGIGSACARLFLAAGARVVLVDVKPAPLDDLAAKLDAGDRVATVVSNLSTPAACAEALETVEGPIHALVHMAGIFRADDLAPQDRESVYDPVIAANLTNAYDMSIACLPRFDPNWPCRIVFASSLAFRRGALAYTAYSAAKGGLVGMTRSLARRLGPKVLVNAVAPGLIETAMAFDLSEENRKFRESQIETIPLKRFGEADEVAAVVGFLCSDASRYVTGQTINIDGGMMNG
ncbi:MAG: SDR family NAD(P)-dependent oxidoreductase [Roseovarius sp.]|nr:SDR family NAD(P)-dependent oxidoreductase [Roseovarius sp.]